MSTIKLLITAFILCSYYSCQKYLDAKPKITYEVISTSADLQALLNNFSGNFSDDPEIELACDDYYIHQSEWNSLFSPYDRKNYFWDANTPDANYSQDYQIIYYTNLVLDNVNNVPGDKATLARIKGTALFYRAAYYFNEAQIFAQPYNKSSADKDLGICVRTTSSVTAPSIRGTVEQTYTQIINDLKIATSLLPLTTQYPIQPTRQAGYGFLARVYLAMSDFTNAKLYSDSCLNISKTLIDYNSLDTSNTYPINNFNAETIYWQISSGSEVTYSGSAVVDTNLYKSYAANDLRKIIFFRYSGLGGFIFTGNYIGQDTGNGTFDGIAVDEIYLTRAECEARAGDVQDAMADLNILLKSRWKANTFIPYTAISSTDALNQILVERRKELVYRGTRWTDLRRLNQDPNYAITLKRNINGQIYTLPPNDLRYTFLIPPTVIAESGMPQTPR